MEKITLGYLVLGEPAVRLLNKTGGCDLISDSSDIVSYFADS